MQDITGFKNLFPSAYTHGLESIYSLEKIDLKSVRRLGSSTVEPKEVIVPKADREVLPNQLELDFGLNYRQWIRPLFLDEPIKVLGLSVQAERCVLDQGMKQIVDLLHTDFHRLIFTKGIGQGHVEEAKTKLRDFIAGRSSDLTYRVDWISFLRCLTATLDPKASCLLLESFGLPSVVSLNTSEAADLRQANKERRQRLIDSAIVGLREPANRVFFMTKWCDIVSSLLRPWVRRRVGVATEAEVLEKLERISVQTCLCDPFVAFANKVYFNGISCFETGLAFVEPRVYCTDAYTAHCFHMIVDRAKSYFKSKGQVYNLSHLCSLVVREEARSGQDLDDAFVTKVLSLSSVFQLRRSPKNKEIAKSTLEISVEIRG